MKKFHDLLETKEYAFLKNNDRLGKRIILLGLAGSYSYGTNNENSDIDFRGITLNKKSDLTGLTIFEQYVDDNTDTVIYSFNKIIKLLMSCNPNTIELLGLKAEHYLYLNDLGKKLIDNRNLFLSKLAIYSFGGYAQAQLRRLQNALARDNYPQSEKEKHILNSINTAMYELKMRYQPFTEDNIKLYIDKAVNKDFVSEIFLDINLKHYPLRDYKNLWADMHCIVKDYDKIGTRNRKKDDNHLNKHAMHLLRLFMMAIDILENAEIVTYREKEHNLLVSIRKGDFQNADGSFKKEFFDLVEEYENKFNQASLKTALPDQPDFDKIQNLVMEVNEEVITNNMF